MTAEVARFVLQLGLVLVAAKLAGELTERWLRQPAAVGEVIAGVVIGPHAAGGLALGSLGPLFPAVTGPVPVSSELYALGQLAAVILLFVTGLETDLALFFRYLGPAVLVGLGGVVLPFVAGAGAAVAAGAAVTFTDPTALFLGAVMTATSVGITARVLADVGKLDTPEAVTVLAAAVVDDVLAIMALAFVVEVARQGHASPSGLVAIGAWAFGIWILLSGIFILGARWLERLLTTFRTPGATATMALAVCFLAAWAAEHFGLAMIIGAYAAGLGLSPRPVARRLQEELEPVQRVLVPIFFVLVGMLVDLRSLSGTAGLAILISALAIVSKVVGCAVPALLAGFNTLGAVRIGVGMLPRGEVALIIAGVGLAAGAIGPAIFGVAVFLTLVTTVLGPGVMLTLLRNPASGRLHGA